jgi:hypothetical protein
MSDQAVRNAEQAVGERKLVIARQWEALKARSVDAVSKPTTLGVLAFAGAVAGWRSAGRDEGKRVVPSAPCDCVEAGKPPASGPMRSLLVGLLRGMATMATEELLRAATAKDANAAQTAANNDPGSAQ